MLSMRLVPRGNIPQYAAAVQRFHTSLFLLDASDSSSSSSDSDKKVSKKALKSKPVKTEEQLLKSREETNKTLDDLLLRMIQKPKLSKSLDLSAPQKKLSEKPKVLSYEKKLVAASKDVAAVLGGDVEKTESELLDKVMIKQNTQAPQTQTQTQDVKSQPTSTSIKELLSGMKFTSTEQAKPSRHEIQQMRAQLAAKSRHSMQSPKFTKRSPDAQKRLNVATELDNLYSDKPLNIFDPARTSEERLDVPELKTWKAMEARELKLVITHPPENIFQEMILWTEQGKLWKFPIDNEQGLEDEQDVHFSEHVFMERHLQGWCPKRGPIRHFMELVCVGLSKNPYMTVKEKKDHIAWYQEYFASKEDLLKEIGAIDHKTPQEPQQILAQ